MEQITTLEVSMDVFPKVPPSPKPGPTIALNMIVKNESKIIKRFLESVYPFIDTYVIMDTGSTDNTIELINEFFKENPTPSKGKIVKSTFENFADTRNLALKFVADKSDYILLLDADMTLQINNQNVFDNRINALGMVGTKEQSPISDKITAFSLLQGTNDFYYNNTRLIPNIEEDILMEKCRYWGYTHEYLSVPGEYNNKHVSKADLFVYDIGDGGCKDDKYERDIRLCKLGIEKDIPNMKQRYYFYLASTYFHFAEALKNSDGFTLSGIVNEQNEEGLTKPINIDKCNNRDGDKDKEPVLVTDKAKAAKYFEDAIKYYKLRIEEGGWDQEVWYSYYRIGLCEMGLKNEMKALNSWLEAYNYYPHRAENLYEMVKHYTTISKHRLADVYYQLAMKVISESQVFREKKDSMLFMHNNVYMYDLLFQYSIYAPYLNRNDLNNEVVHLLNNGPDHVYSTVLSNMKFYHNTLFKFPKTNKFLCMYNKKFDGLNYFDTDKGYSFVSSSSCLTLLNNTNNLNNAVYGMNVRMVNYTIIKETGEYKLPEDGIIASENMFIILDKNFNIIKEPKSLEITLEYSDEEINNIPSKYTGIEDIRIFNTTDNGQSNDIMFFGTTFHKSTQKIGMVVGEYDFEKSRLKAYEVHAQFALEEPCEKNWVFVQSNSKLYVIYKWGPDFTLCELDNKAEQDNNDNLDDDKSTDDENDDKIFILKPIEKRINAMPNIFKHVRGSTSGCTIINKESGENGESEKEIWFICHLVSYENPRHYYHMFVVMDEELNLKRYSAPFKFEGESIEYCLSLIVEDDKVIVNYSLWDSSTYISVYNKRYIDTLCVYKA